ncbi:Nif11-like leader peptide family RiPP precursor [Alkaliphilus peptidifermentans]|uniref:Nif11-like leader peptide domain-containing protein n=1 Tax=Alkaliphilus peptidifermentans DSM 18978 TaxID=1120976 RepID=A0A1G5EUT1_9FIRM|nr:Nif11-like leader peptide family RiPP precursor [Alkaliphilus peptidifermentans]SCY30756.1 nif11-like leader peptide domain-containing protein [Alkaliphilus peptidifermentans DSM 18978]
MSEALKNLVDKVKADNNLQKRFQECKSKEEQVELAAELGFDITVEELEQASKVSDDQLDQVAGGGCTLYVQCIF